MQLASANTTHAQPTIIRDLGYTAASAQLLSIPLYALATLFTVAWAILSERHNRRAPFIMATSALGIVGYIFLLSNSNPTRRPGVSYVGTFFAAAGTYPSTALVLSWPANNVSAQTKRATANAMQISIGNLGAVLGAQLYRPVTSPRYLLGHGFALGYLGANIIVVGILWVVLTRENGQKEREAAEQGISDARGPNEAWKGDEHVRWRFTV